MSSSSTRTTPRGRDNSAPISATDFVLRHSLATDWCSLRMVCIASSARVLVEIRVSISSWLLVLVRPPVHA